MIMVRYFMICVNSSMFSSSGSVVSILVLLYYCYMVISVLALWYGIFALNIALM